MRGFFFEGDEELLELEEEDDDEEEDEAPEDEAEWDEDSVSSRFRSFEPRCRAGVRRRPLLHLVALPEPAAFECADWPSDCGI